MPFCPECHQEPDLGARCPLCGLFYRERHCPECGWEVFPRETFCGACGAELGGRALAQVHAPMQPAGLGRRVVATLFDLVVLVLITELLQVTLLSSLWVSVPVSGLLYYGFFQARGRQTLGQYVLRLTALTSERYPLKLAQSLLRSLLGALSWALVIPLLLALRDPERLTPVDRLLKVQVYLTP